MSDQTPWFRGNKITSHKDADFKNRDVHYNWHTNRCQCVLLEHAPLKKVNHTSAPYDCPARSKQEGILLFHLWNLGGEKELQASVFVALRHTGQSYSTAELELNLESRTIQYPLRLPAKKSSDIIGIENHPKCVFWHIVFFHSFKNLGPPTCLFCLRRSSCVAPSASDGQVA